MWDSLKDHIAIIGGILVALLGILGWFVKFALDKGVIEPIRALRERIEKTEAAMQKIEGNYVAEFRTVRREIAESHESAMKGAQESERRILGAIGELKDYIADNYVRRDEHLRNVGSHQS